MTKNHDQNISRRRFLRYGLEAGIAVSFVGGLHSLSQAKAYVRPPGSIIADDFTSRCMRCSGFDSVPKQRSEHAHTDPVGVPFQPSSGGFRVQEPGWSSDNIPRIRGQLAAERYR